MAKNKALEIDMCAGSELRDSQGETLSIEGADISELEAGKGRLNDNHGKGFFNSIGLVTEAKKIFKAEDCENERHRYYWEQTKAPYLYVRGRIYNDEDHPNAKAAAAILRNIHKSDCPLKIKASVEGGVISRGLKDPSRLERTKIHSIAITFTPANKATLVEPLNIVKSLSEEQNKVDQELIKSVMHLAEENVPSFRHVQRNAQANKIISNIEKIQELAKATGINIHIEETDTETLIKNAIEAKVLNNVQKIKELMKAYRAESMWGEPNTAEVKTKLPGRPGAKYNIARNPSVNKPESPKAEYVPQVPTTETHGPRPSGELTTPDAPGAKPGPVPVKSVASVRAANTFKIHAQRAHKDEKYLDSLQTQLEEHNVDRAKIDTIVGKIKQHMEKSEDDIEKGGFKDAARAAVVAGTLAMGAYNMGPKKDSDKPKEKPQVVKEIPHHEKEIQWDPRKPIDPKGKYRKPTLKESMERMKQKKVKKALTAGYGGGGSPMDLAGGGVMQSEKQEKGFKYIICKDCGKEQVYSQHQVKCRECGKNFSLKDLHALISS